VDVRGGVCMRVGWLGQSVSVDAGVRACLRTCMRVLVLALV
jgi:hypothetical protein